jgi:hypothetical protein
VSVADTTAVLLALACGCGEWANLRYLARDEPVLDRAMRAYAAAASSYAVLVLALYVTATAVNYFGHTMTLWTPLEATHSGEPVRAHTTGSVPTMGGDSVGRR